MAVPGPSLPQAAIGGGAGAAGGAGAGGAQGRPAAGGCLRSAPLRALRSPRPLLLSSPLRSPPPQRGPAAAKTPRAVLRVKNGAAKLAKPPAAAGETPGGAPGPGLFMERSQSRLSLSASFEALAIYFPCMNSFDEEDAGTGGRGGERSGGGGSRGSVCVSVRRGRCGQRGWVCGVSAPSPTPLGFGGPGLRPGGCARGAGDCWLRDA